MKRPAAKPKCGPGVKKDLPVRPHPAESQKPSSKPPGQTTELWYCSDCSGIDVGCMALKKLFKRKKKAVLHHWFASEIDAPTRSVLQATHPGIQQIFTDATKHDLKELVKFKMKNVEGLLAYTSGFPCQPYSKQGKGEGAQDSEGRGQVVYYELQLVAEILPDFGVFENVATLATNPKYRDVFEDILLFLTKMGNSCYYVDYKIMDSYKVGGVPASRERVYIIFVKKSKLVKKWEWPKEIPPTDLATILESHHPRMLPEQLSNTNLHNLAKGLDKLQSEGVKNALSKPYIMDLCGGKGFPVNVQFNKLPTITKAHANGLWLLDKHRFLSPTEIMAGQGIMPGDITRPPKVSEKKLAEMAGNSFTLPVFERLFATLLPSVGFSLK